MKKNIIFILLFIIAISLFLNLFYAQQSPPGVNDDEAGFAYNAYSIMKTGKDEHGNLLPLRLQSYGDYKLPLYAYSSVPFIKIFGLNIFALRFLNNVLIVLMVLLIFLLVDQLFNSKTVALLTAFLFSASTWTHIISRNAHEGLLCLFLILTGTWLFLKYKKKSAYWLLILANLFFLLATFAYHFGRIFFLFFVVWQFYYFFKNKKSVGNLFLNGLTAIVFVIIPFFVDLMVGSNRANFLLFTNNLGFVLRITEYLNEHGIRVLHNKLTQAVIEFSYHYLNQFSPHFFFSSPQFFPSGDNNYRWAYPYLGLITPIEYILLFIGLFFLFKNKQNNRFFVMLALLITAIPNALTFQEFSLVRNYAMIIPISIISAYGFYNLIRSLAPKIKVIIPVILISAYLFFLTINWDFYIFHYPKRPFTIRAWQCGRKEVAAYVKNNYSKYDNFVISNKDGQMYMFLLFFLDYDPAKYQNQHNQYFDYGDGFLTMKKFDKFSFDFYFDDQKKKTVFIGYPEDFPKSVENKVEKIIFNNQEIYWIYAVK